MRKFLVEYSFKSPTEPGSTSTSSYVISAYSKYDAKRTFKRAYPDTTIVRITPYEE